MSEGASSSSSLKLCGICNEKPLKYCCPRCDVFYCSLDCYKSEKHASCSESFYRDCVNEELASVQNDDESKRKMIEILKKMRVDDDLNLDENVSDGDENVNEENDSDDQEEPDLHERVKDLNLDDPDAIWNVLTEDERNEFEAMLNQGDVGSILPQWEPWWNYSKDARLVQDLACKEEEEALKKCPKIIDVPKLCSLTSVTPSPAISFNITNVLASYAFVLRYFNGELDPVEGISYFLTICANLDTNTNFDDPATAMESVKQKCLQSNLIETDKTSLEIMKRDTFFLLQGPSEENKLHYSLSALSHLHTTLARARSATKLLKTEEKPTKLPKLNNKLPKLEIDTAIDNSLINENSTSFSKKFPDNKGDYLPKLDVNKLKKCMKKVEFYISFIETCGLDFEEN